MQKRGIKSPRDNILDTPFQANIGKNKAIATKHEWQTDSLAAAAANGVVEGDDTTSSYTFSSVTATTRLYNTLQISRKDVIVSGTQDAVSKAGREREIVYQLVKRQKELRRDMEFVLTNNQTTNTGNSSTARLLRPLVGWYSTNVKGNGNTAGDNGTTSAARNDLTQVALTETKVKQAIQLAWTSGGDIDLIMCGPFNKTVISGFTGNNTRMQDTSDKKLVTSVDVYVSDFGSHKIVANRFSRERDVHLLTTDLWAVSYLRPVKTIDIAKTGDNEKGMILAEYTLEARNEAGSALVADLTTS